MNPKSIRSLRHNTTTIGLDEKNEKGAELQSLVWSAAKSLTSPDLMQRIGAIDRLLEYDVVKQLPLLAYLLITRIEEPDIEIRTRIVKSLGEVSCTSLPDFSVSEEVKSAVMYHLSRLRTREIFALLQVAEYDKSSEPYIASMLSCSSFAGGHLSKILSARETPNEIRRQAAHFIGSLGFLDALPELERMVSRFAGRNDGREADLYIELQNAVELLTAT